MLGKKHSDETKEIIKNKRALQIFSSETLLKLRNRPKITCEHCGKTIPSPNYSKSHGEKCKFKNLSALD
jgi:hypothetical protein